MNNNKDNLTLDTIMENHYHEIFHYIRKQTQSTEDAKDLTQDVFMKVYTKLHTYNPDKASHRTWLYRIAHNHMVNFFRKADQTKRMHIDPHFIDSLPDEDDVLENAIQHENVTHILKVMSRVLNKKHYKIMNLYFFSELSVESIGETLNIPIKTVYNTVNTSIKKIKKIMEGAINEYLPS